MKNQDETTVVLQKKRIYDPILIFLHWWNGLFLFSLLVTVWSKSFIKQFEHGKDILWKLHIFIGYAFSIGIILRILWGFIGPNHARFKNMIFINQWFSILKTGKFQKSNHWGHDIYASFAYLVFYICTVYQIISGLILAARKFSMGPLTSYFSVPGNSDLPGGFHDLKQIHEIVYYISMIYIVLHIFMIIFHEFKDGRPIAQSMLSGNQYRKKD